MYIHTFFPFYQILVKIVVESPARDEFHLHHISSFDAAIVWASGKHLHSGLHLGGLRWMVFL
jgi:hypothetical protein